MKTQYIHNFITSFYMWIDHKMLEKGENRMVKTSRLFYGADSRLGDKMSYSSPYKQWVAETYSGVTAPVISGASGAITGADIIIDYDNGRVLLPTGYGSGQVLSGTYTIKEVNTYMVDDGEMGVIFENSVMNDRYIIYPDSGVQPYWYAMPAGFITPGVNDNKPYAFGGEDDSRSTIRVIFTTRDVYTRDACLSVCNDLSHSWMPLLKFDSAPFNEYGDLKSGCSGSYVYDTTACRDLQRYVYVENVRISRFSPYGKQTSTNPQTYVGIADFALSDIRYPHL